MKKEHEVYYYPYGGPSCFACCKPITNKEYIEFEALYILPADYRVFFLCSRKCERQFREWITDHKTGHIYPTRIGGGYTRLWKLKVKSIEGANPLVNKEIAKKENWYNWQKQLPRLKWFFPWFR